MTLEIYKIIGPANMSSSLKIGSNRREGNKDIDKLPSDITAFLRKPSPSLLAGYLTREKGINQSTMYSGYGFLDFRLEEVPEMGVLDPAAKTKVYKVCRFIYDPTSRDVIKRDKKKFIKALNYMIQFFNTGFDGVPSNILATEGAKLYKEDHTNIPGVPVYLKLVDTPIIDSEL
jgi:hypothetical protein